ncbi:hypothetical protein [Flavobacterium wongokense]|uniref:hypothetical protein n=1 Tax=Flavobacterium wongokense TaxID=2910674 RepID=UPI001F29087E|nr:hypothetical protein [Flavobacterium sp. WG47]MCF6131309.1 hypothetical protein [Flavobacterium sp. WG47]
MRKLFLILSIAFLFQSCFTYRAYNAPASNMEVGRTYKIERNNKSENLKIKAIDENNVTIMSVGRQETFPLSEITKIHSRRMSVLKTAALPVIVIGSLVGLAVVAWQ